MSNKVCKTNNYKSFELEITQIKKSIISLQSYINNQNEGETLLKISSMLIELNRKLDVLNNLYHEVIK